MTTYEEIKKIVDDLLYEEGKLKFKLKLIEQEKKDIVFLLLGKEELLSENAREVWEQVKKENENDKRVN